MRKNLGHNLLMENLTKSKIFFLKQGFKLNSKFPTSDRAASFIAGNNKIDLMLFEKPIFERVSKNEITETTIETEAFFSISTENNEEVNEMSTQSLNLGDKVFANSKVNDGWIYECGFWIENLEIRLYNKAKEGS